MNSKLTIVFAGILVVLLAAYFLYTPGSGGGDEVKAREPVLPESISGRSLTGIDLIPAEGTPISLERAPSGGADLWRVRRPIDREADGEAVKLMLYGLDRFRRQGEMERGTPETAPEITGLDAPRLTVVFHAGTERATIRLGKQPPTNSTAVFYEVEGGDKVYLLDAETYATYAKPLSEIRAKRLLQFQPHRVTKFELSSRFIVAREGEKEGKVEYEKSVIENLDQGEARGWHLVEPWKEILDPLKSSRLLAGLAQMMAKEFRETGSLEAKGLAEPDTIVRLFIFGRTEPLEFRISGKGPDKKTRWVRVGAADEVGVVEHKAIRQLPFRRNDFRLDRIFRFTSADLKTITVAARGLGKTVVERREKQRGPDAPVTATWNVVEPSGVRVDDGKVEQFVRTVLVQKIDEFYGPQDFKLVNLDPADVVVTVGLKKGEPQHFYFGRTSTGGFLRREGLKEVYTVQPSLVDNLKRMELNFLHKEVFSVARESLLRFDFEWKGGGGLVPVRYAMKHDPETKFWEFDDDANRRKTPNRERLSDLLTFLNYISARNFITRDPRRIRELGLNDVRAAGRLRIWHAGGPEGGTEFLISRNQSEIVQTEKYFMLQRGDTAVFEVNPLLVESLKVIPVKEQ